MVRVVLAIFLIVLMTNPIAAQGAIRASDKGRPPAKPVINILVDGKGDWIVRYQFDRPINRMAFDRSPDASRTKTWGAPPGFHIFRQVIGDQSGDEVVSRIDGKRFRQVDLRIPPLYRDLPSDYAPFAPFGDGSILFYTGRLFACAPLCSIDDKELWRMRLIVRDKRRILLNGQTFSDGVQWLDSDGGRYVYIGDGKLTDAGVVNAVIDRALPDNIRLLLEQQLPMFMAYFEERLGKLESRPALFASYDAAHPGGGWGRQGGTLPGQIFTHFYGNHWPVEFAKPDFANDLAWHFAHEAGHLYQRGIATENARGWWIHEGGAEAFAAIALRDSGTSQADYVAQRIASARQSCATLLRDTSLHLATSRQNNTPAYQCGLLVNLALDAALKKQKPTGDGLYAVWRVYLARKANKQSTDEAAFLASVAEVGGKAVANKLALLLDTPKPDFDLVVNWAREVQRGSRRSCWASRRSACQRWMSCCVHPVWPPVPVVEQLSGKPLASRAASSIPAARLAQVRFAAVGATVRSAFGIR